MGTSVGMCQRWPWGGRREKTGMWRLRWGSKGEMNILMKCRAPPCWGTGGTVKAPGFMHFFRSGGSAQCSSQEVDCGGQWWRGLLAMTWGHPCAVLSGSVLHMGAAPCEPNMQNGELSHLLLLVKIEMIFFPFNLQCISHPHSKSSSFPSRTVCLGKTKLAAREFNSCREEQIHFCIKYQHVKASACLWLTQGTWIFVSLGLGLPSCKMGQWKQLRAVVLM